MKKCIIFIIFVLINIFLLIIPICLNIEKFKNNLFNKSNDIKSTQIINKRILTKNNNDTKKEKNKNDFFLKNYNITLYSYEELKNEFVHLLFNYPSNKSLKYYTVLIRNKYFLFNLANKKSTGYSYSNHSLDEIKFYNSFWDFRNQSRNFNYSLFNNIDIYFYKGKNLTSYKDILIMEENDFSSNKTIFLFADIDDIIIEIDKNNSLFKLKIPESKLYDEEYNNKQKCNALTQMIFNLRNYSININMNKKNELIKFYTTDNNHFYMMLKPSCLETKIWFTLYNEFHNNNILNNSDKKDKNKAIFDIKLILAIIFSSLINCIYIIKFMVDIFKKRISIFSICVTTFFFCYIYDFYYMCYTISASEKAFNGKASLTLKIISVLSNIFSFINFICIYYIGTIFQFFLFCKRNISLKISCFQLLLFFSSLIINYKLFFNIGEKKYFILISCISWGSQIIKNIISNNKYILPLFYYIFFTTHKIIFAYLDDTSIHLSIKQSLLLLTINIAEIIIIYLQGYYGPRFMFGPMCREKNNTIYRTKEELLREKPNSKNEFCCICLSSFFNNNKNDIVENQETKTDTELNLQNVNLNTSNEISQNKSNNKIIVADSIIIEQKNQLKLYKNMKYKCNGKKIKKIIKYIFKKYFWDYHFYDSKIKRDYALLRCGHFFHSNCINMWINVEKKCPICRQDIPQN